MNPLIIFGAKYLFLLDLLFFLVFFLLMSRARQKSLLILSATTFPMLYFISRLASYFYFNARPFVVGNFQPLISHSADNGFPSDHMLLTSAIAIIIYAYNKKLGVVAGMIAGLVGVSRVLAGVHHWLDIVASALIAVIVIWLVQKLIWPIFTKHKFIA